MPRTVCRIRPTPVCVAVWASLMAPLAIAQTTAPKTETATESIVISGSRIKRDTFTSTAPVLILRNEDAAIAGFTSTSDVLQGTAVTGGQGQINNAYGGYVTDGGPGANTIGLRGFGPTRSLVLLNGRRLAPSGTRGAVGAADLNTLPDAIIDRIEVLKDGASSIYGSDAIAGVVNIITKKKAEGITAGLKYSQPDGGGAERRFSLVGGFVSDRSRLSGSYEFYERDELTLGDRDWTRCNTDYRRTDGNSPWGSRDFIDPSTGQPKCYPISGTGSNGVTINTLGTPSVAGVGAPGSVGSSFNRWRPNANVTTGLVGYEGVGGGANNLNVRDTFDPRTLNRSTISPTKNHNLFVQGGVDLSTGVDLELYYEAMFNRRDSSQTGFRQLSLDYNKGSPLIPANLNFAGNFLASSDTSGGRPVGVRAFIGYGNDQSSQTVDFGRAVLGLRGTVPKTSWEFDLVGTHNESKGKYSFEAAITSRLAQSLNVVSNGSGGYNCVDSSGGCVAAPALTAAVIGGQLPQGWVNYMWTTVTGVAKYKEDTLSASTTGKLFDLPYGKLKGAFGVELRQYSIDDTPPPESINGTLYNFTAAAPTRGKDKVFDTFAEIDIPLLANLPLAQELNLNISGRWSDYDSYGKGSTYKAGALWSPVKWLSLRGTVGTSYRAPALFEQFLGATSGFQASSNDPCNGWDAPGNIGSVRSNNCASEGLPAGYAVGNGNNQSIAVLTTGGASAGLKAETSKNTTFGIVFQPALGGFGDLSVAVDYFDIQVENGVARAGFSEILSRCYDDPQFRAGGGFCRLINPRNPANRALTVNDSYVNLATDKVRGLDYTLRYTTNIGIGKFRANVKMTEYRLQANKLFAEDPLDDVNGTIGTPKRTGTVDLNYEYKGWRFYYGLDWVGKTDSYAYLEEDPATSTYKLNTPDYYLHTVSVGYKGDKWDVTVGVRNLADKAPPQISAQAGYNRVGNAPLYSGYDYVGRRVYVNASKTF